MVHIFLIIRMGKQRVKEALQKVKKLENGKAITLMVKLQQSVILMKAEKKTD